MNEKRTRSIVPLVILLVLLFFLGSWIFRAWNPQGLPLSLIHISDPTRQAEIS